MTEYEFTLPDGSMRYEICDGAADVHAFMRMHKAVAAMPANRVRALRDALQFIAKDGDALTGDECAAIARDALQGGGA